MRTTGPISKDCADTVTAENEVQSFEAVGNADTKFRTAVLRVFLLEGFDFFAENVPGRAHEAKISFIELRFELFVRTDKIKERNFHELVMRDA